MSETPFRRENAADEVISPFPSLMESRRQLSTSSETGESPEADTDTSGAAHTAEAALDGEPVRKRSLVRRLIPRPRHRRRPADPDPEHFEPPRPIPARRRIPAVQPVAVERPLPDDPEAETAEEELTGPTKAEAVETELATPVEPEPVTPVEAEPAEQPDEAEPVSYTAVIESAPVEEPAPALRVRGPQVPNGFKTDHIKAIEAAPALRVRGPQLPSELRITPAAGYPARAGTRRAAWTASRFQATAPSYKPPTASARVVQLVA